MNHEGYLVNFEQLTSVDAAAKDILKKLKEKYVGLDSSLVYASRLGQAPLGTNAKGILIGHVAKGKLQAFRDMVLESDSKAKALKALSERDHYKEGTPDYKEIDAEIDGFCSCVEFDEQVQVQLRFGELKYEQLWQLQSDELVDQALTPKSKSSIQIVLGSLKELLERHNDTK